MFPEAFIYSFVLIAAAANIQILDLTSNPGLAQISKGNAFIQKGSSQLTHLIDLRNFEFTINQIENIAKTFNTENDFNLVLTTKIFGLKTAYESIKPRNRVKRSWEALGSGIKWLAGNPDADDLRDLHNAVSQLSNSNNDQLELNKVFEDKINEIIKTLASSVQKNLDLTLASLDIINLMFNIDLARESLENIREALSLAKSHIVSKNILGKNEITFVKSKLTAQNLNPTSDAQILPFLKPHVSYFDNTILYRVSIPQLSHPFKNIIVQPIPLKKKIIKLDFKEILTDGSTTYAIKGQCLENGEHTVCDQHQLTDISEDQCIPRLLQAQQGDCIFSEIKPKRTTIMIEDDTLLLSTATQATKLFNTCGAANNSMIGTFLITFKNCTIFVGEDEFQNLHYQSRKPLEILPMFNATIKQKNLEPSIDIHDLHDLHVKNREKLHLMESQQKEGTFILTILIATAVVLFLTIFIMAGLAMLKLKTSPRAVSKQNGEELSPSPCPKPSPFPFTVIQR